MGAGELTEVARIDSEACFANQEDFYRAFYNFLYTPPFSNFFGRWQANVVVEVDSSLKTLTKIRSGEQPYFNYRETSGSKRYKDLDDRVKISDEFFPDTCKDSDLEIKCGYTTTNNDLWDQMDPYVVPETVSNISFGALAVFISMLFFIDFRAALIVVICVLIIDLFLLAYIPLVGFRLSAISSITIVMAVGFAIDYSSDIVFAFFLGTGSRNENAKYAVDSMTRPIFAGAISSVLSVLPLAFLNSQVAEIFAVMVMGIVVVGLMVGYILLPVALSLCAPSIANNDTTSSTLNDSTDTVLPVVYTNVYEQKQIAAVGKTITMKTNK